MSTPRLGVSLVAVEGGPGLAVKSVNPALQPTIPTGQVWLSAGGADGTAVLLNQQVIMPEPDLLPYQALADFYQQQSQLVEELRTGEFRVRLDSGAVVVLKTHNANYFQSLTAIFWAHAVYSLIAIALVAGVWVFRRSEQSAQLLMVSGVGFYLLNFGPAIYANRELAIDGLTFQWLSWLNHTGTALNITSLAALMWIYPRRLGSQPIVPGLYVLTALALLMDVLRVGGSAALTHYVPLLLTFISGVAFAAVQWRRSRAAPLDRASLRWMVMAIFWATSASIFLLVVPVILGFDQVLPQHLGFAPLLVMYVGLIAGILRYKLFELETWWVKSWIWMAAGALVICVDLLLVAVLGWSHPSSAMFSLFLAGFIYFPLRQLAWDRLASTSDDLIAKAISDMAAALVAVQNLAELEKIWLEQLKRIFQPLQCEVVSEQEGAPRVDELGTTLIMSRPGGQGSVRLLYPSSGARLFNRRDLGLAQAIADVSGQGAKALTARTLGATQERERIMRDLHDDLGAKLLTLVHSSKDQTLQGIARAALVDLRSIVAAREHASVALPILMQMLQQEFEQRVTLAELIPVWQLQGEIPNRTMAGRWSANVTRIAREALSNAIRHARATRITLTIRVASDYLSMQIEDDGAAGDISAWQSGRGMVTMQQRASESGFELQIAAGEGEGTRMTLHCPL